MTDASRKRVVVVTGGGGGIGRALCLGFDRDHHLVIAVGRNEGSLKETCSLCPSGQARFIQADLSQPSECVGAMEAAVAIHGRVEILVNNAGLGGWGSFLGRPLESWTDVISVNLVGVAACTHAVLPHMIERRHGRIIIIQSNKARSSEPEANAYCASKAGAYAFSRCLAGELEASGHRDVLINNLIPGPTKSGMCPSGQPPDRVYPFVLELAQPSFRHSGGTFFRGRRRDLDGVREVVKARARQHLRGLLRGRGRS